MNIHGGEQQKIPGGQAFEAVTGTGCTLVAAGFVTRAVVLVEQHAPEAGAAATSLGFVAAFFTGLAIHEAYVFFGPHNQR